MVTTIVTTSDQLECALAAISTSTLTRLRVGKNSDLLDHDYRAQPTEPLGLELERGVAPAALWQPSKPYQGSPDHPQLGRVPQISRLGRKIIRLPNVCFHPPVFEDRHHRSHV